MADHTSEILDPDRQLTAALARAERAERTAADAQRRLEEVRRMLTEAQHRGSTLHNVGAWQRFTDEVLATITRAEATGEPSAPALDPADALALARAAMTWSIAKGDGSRFIDTHDAELMNAAVDALPPVWREAAAKGGGR